MAKVKMTSSKDLLAQQLKIKKIADAYEELSEEFSIAKEVLQLRTDANLTQTELAKLAGTSQPAIARLESGAYRNVSLSFLRKVGRVLGAIPEVHFQKVA